MATDQVRTFGLLLKHYREAAGQTQEALAERAGVSARTISDLERGISRVPRGATLALLARALALSAGDRARLEAAAGRGTSRASARTALPTGAHQPPLVGRRRDLILLERHLAGEGPPLLLLAGQPGIGKSRLLREAAGRADGLGWRVLTGGCTRVGGQQPYAPLLQAVAGALAGRSAVARRADLRGCAWLVRLLPELADEGESLAGWRLPPDQERRLMFGAVRRFLGNIAGPAGTIMLLDDLQWAGPDALELLAALLQQGEGAPLRVIGAYRDTDVETGQPLLAAVARLAEAQLVREWLLRPLAAAEAHALIAEVLDALGHPQAAPLAPVIERAGGVPFFLLSYARSLAEAAGMDPGGPRVPWDLRASIRQRVAVLPALARGVLEVAAVSGRRAPRPLLLGVLAVPEPEGFVALEQACRAGLLQEAGDDGYGFVHDVIHEVVESDLGLARRRALHRQVAAALEGQGGAAPVEALAYHFRAAGEPARAAVYLERAAAMAAARYAHAEAAAHYRNLVACLEELGREDDSRHAREQLARALANLAQFDAALAELERVGEALRAAGDAAGVCRIEVLIAEIYADTGALPVGIARLQRAIPALEAGGPGPVLAGAQYILGRLLTFNGHSAQALDSLARAIDSARVADDFTILIKAQTSLAFALMLLGCSDEALPVIEGAVEEAGQRAPCWALSILCWIYDERGDYTQSRRAAEQTLAIAERNQDPVDIAHALVLLNSVAFLTGDWPRARSYLQRSMALTDQAGITGGHFYAMPRCDLGCLLLAKGAYDEATQCFEAVLASFEGTDERVLRPIAHAHLAERDVLVGHPEAAVARLLPVLDPPGMEELMVTQYVLPVLAWAQCELGELDQAASTAAEAIRRARRATLRPALVRALRVQALVLLAQERSAEAAGSLEEGLALARAMPYPHAEGRLLHAEGLLQARQGESGLARAQLEAARSIFQRLGARPDMERTEQLLATLG